MHATPAPWIGYVVFGAVLLILFLRVRGMRRARRLRLETLWIAPAILGAVFVAMVAEYPPRDALTWLWIALALIVGAAIGWRRGKLMAIRVDPATHALNQQASPAALLFVVLLIVARQGLRYEAATLGLNILQVTGILTAFAAGLVIATRTEMFVRARRLLEEARRQAGAGSSIGPISAR